MIKLEDFIKLNIKEITYKGNKYIIKFTKSKMNDDDDDDELEYYINLYDEDDYNYFFDHPKSVFRKLLYKANLSYFIENYVLESDISSHSPTYIQNVIELFFKEYLKLKEANENSQIEYKTQIKNFKEWDGVIKYD